MENMQQQITDSETMRKLPIIFQELKVTKLENKATEWDEKPKFIKVDFYQTPQYKADSHYKPLSKIIKNQS